MSFPYLRLNDLYLNSRFENNLLNSNETRHYVTGDRFHLTVDTIMGKCPDKRYILSKVQIYMNIGLGTAIVVHRLGTCSSSSSTLVVRSRFDNESQHLQTMSDGYLGVSTRWWPCLGSPQTGRRWVLPWVRDTHRGFVFTQTDGHQGECASGVSWWLASPLMVSQLMVSQGIGYRTKRWFTLIALLKTQSFEIPLPMCDQSSWMNNQPIIIPIETWLEPELTNNCDLQQKFHRKVQK